MKVKQSIIDKVNNPQSRARIGLKIGCGDQMLYRHFQRNLNNGRLTKMDALKAIAEEAQVDLNDVLQEEEVKEPTKVA